MRPWFARLAALGAAAAVFGADWATGAEVSLSFFYLIPVAIAAWWGGPADAALAIVASLGGWLASYFLTGEYYSESHILLWNAAIETAIFTAIALGLRALRAGFARERTLRERLEVAYARIDDEMSAVGALQRRMLPTATPSLPGLAIATHYAPSTRAGGDYYDFLPLSRDRLAVFLGDASGHGSAAAVLMAMTRVLLRTADADLERPAMLLASLHERLRRTAPEGTFVTACLLVVDPTRETIDYAIAGHEPPLLVRAGSGAIEPLLNPSGLPLAFPGPATFETRRARFAPGDSLVLFTDGLTESLSPTSAFFDLAGVHRAIELARPRDAETLVASLCAARDRHAGRTSLDDDLTVLVLQAVAVPAVIEEARFARA